MSRPTADTYRFRAEQMRVLAEQEINDVARKIMLQCAHDYEGMAAGMDAGAALAVIPVIRGKFGGTR